MKKNIYLIVTLLLSLFIFCSKVDAAKELTCVYPDYNISGDGILKMVTQDGKGKIRFWTMVAEEKDVTEMKRDGWKESNKKLDFSNTKYYQNEVLTACPLTSAPIIQDPMRFYDEEKTWYNPIDASEYSSSLIERLSGEKLPSVAGGEPEDENEKANLEEIKNTDWIAKCAYSIDGNNGNEKIYMYFNREKVLFDVKKSDISSAKAGFSIDQMMQYYAFSESCPILLYESKSCLAYDLYGNCKAMSYPATYYIDKPKTFSDIPITVLNIIGSESVVYGVENSNSDESLVIESCGDLFGPDLLKKIRQIMNWVKYIVPIMLLVLGTLDFTKGVFSQKEDDMAKIRKTFIMRVVAAILVFIAPIFVNLLLTIANEVWDYIVPDDCIETSK